ncbi:Efflux transporter, RND family, MFP subunit [Candidatus Sulfopaludibacter sp. SbA3]|nr:Efflux transporter, RND family, MFP subunit [Candidatus Sulfopaludibacter sp. SbA3]
MRYLLFLPIPVLLLSSCGSEPSPRAAQAQAAPVPVRVAAVSAQDWPASYEATGTVHARVTGTIASKVMGYVQQVSVQVGDHVREGQVLITLDARDLDAAVRRAEAGRAQVESAIPEAENGTAAAKANLDLAQATFRRMEELAAKKSISNQEMDEASARLKAAQANFEMTRSRRTQLNSRMAEAEQEVRAAAIMRDYTKVTAPFAGVVVTKSVEQGNLATPGAPLLTIEQDGQYRLEASVDESKLASVRVGQAVEVITEPADRKLNARVSEIVPSVDPASRTYIVKLDLPAASGLRTGMFGRAIFPLSMQKVAAIPVDALMERGQLQSVFVVEDGLAHTRLVTTGRRTGDAVEVLSGLNAGEKVIVSRPPQLQDGSRVEVGQ